MKRATRTATGLGAIVLGTFGIGWTPGAAVAAAPPASPPAPKCEVLQTDPAYGLVGNKAIKSVTSAKTTAGAAPHVQYCRVTLVYGTKPDQNITIVVGLPLSAADNGTGGIPGAGAWNGRTQGLGGGGCAGNLN